MSRESIQLKRDGMVAPFPLTCCECGSLLRVGSPVFCADGYARVYGEYLLSDDDGLHEENWPIAHVRCVDGVFPEMT